jgi:hypothetical protein
LLSFSEHFLRDIPSYKFYWVAFKWIESLFAEERHSSFIQKELSAVWVNFRIKIIFLSYNWRIFTEKQKNNSKKQKEKKTWHRLAGGHKIFIIFRSNTRMHSDKRGIEKQKKKNYWKIYIKKVLSLRNLNKFHSRRFSLRKKLFRNKTSNSGQLIVQQKYNCSTT